MSNMLYGGQFHRASSIFSSEARVSGSSLMNSSRPRIGQLLHMKADLSAACKDLPHRIVSDIQDVGSKVSAGNAESLKKI